MPRYATTSPAVAGSGASSELDGFTVLRETTRARPGLVRIVAFRVSMTREDRFTTR